MEILVFETALRHCAVARFDNVVCGLTFGYSSPHAATTALKQVLAERDCSAGWRMGESHGDEIVARIQRFAQGEPVDFSDVSIEEAAYSDFQCQVVRACRTISWGETITYGELAQQVQRPGAARAVGTVMSSNRYPLIVPCHRVVPASGGLGGFSAPQGVRMKRRLLELEANALAFSS